MSEFETIQAQIEQLQQQAKEMITVGKETSIDDIVGKMDVYGITLDDIKRAIGRVRKSANPAPIKFRDSEGNKWAGRGLTPKWLTALLAQGRKKEEFSVA